MPTVRWVPSGAGPQGAFGQTPRGVILHGSRSGRVGIGRQEEFDSTSGWAANPSNVLGWNITCGEDEYDRHLDERDWGWDAFQASTIYLGCEFAQAVEAWPITDAQVRAFCHWFATYARTVWPGLPLHMPTHAEVEHSGETGRPPTGKTDVFSYSSPRTAELRARILARLASQYGIR